MPLSSGSLTSRPFDLDEFVRAWNGSGTGRSGCPRSAQAPAFRAAVDSTAEADYIYHEQGTTPYHQTHIALHELAHMLLDHRGALSVGEASEPAVPNVDPQLVQLVLGRSMYSTEEERDAETLASLIHEQSGDQPQPLPPAGPQTGAFVKRLQRAWGDGE